VASGATVIGTVEKRHTGLEGQYVLTAKRFLTISKILTSDCSLACKRMNVFGTVNNAA